QSIIDNCECLIDEDCRFNERKGRLLLSLPWLDQDFDDEQMRERLIHDVFMMLVSNARGPYWDNYVSCTSDFDCASDELCDMNRPTHVCVDAVSRQSRRESLISRTAASLTANMLDYMDDEWQCISGSNNGEPCSSDNDCPNGVCRLVERCVGGGNNGLRCLDHDDCPNGSCSLGIPTRVALRSFDFNDPAAAGRPILRVCESGSQNGQRCVDDSDCPGGSCGHVRECVGGPKDGHLCPNGDIDCPGGVCRPTSPYVYGLERQPYITEIASYGGNASGTPPPDAEYAVELFNPYPDDIGTWTSNNTGYFLRIEPSGKEVRLIQHPVPGRANQTDPDYLVVTNKAATAAEMPKLFPEGSSSLLIEDTTTTSSQTGYDILSFANGDIIYLVRKEYYPDPTNPSVTNLESIVVDQFAVNGANIALPSPSPDTPYSIERAGVLAGAAPWFAPIPADKNTESATHSLGQDNTPNLGGTRPVEVRFANTGSFATAFPTTGSLLLLMRHANRLFDEYPRTKDLAFTTWLDDPTTWTEGTGLVTVHENTQIDNGRMPVFDQGENINPGNPTPSSLDWRYAHHVHPATGACCVQGAAGPICDETFATTCTVMHGQFLLGADCSTDPCVIDCVPKPGKCVGGSNDGKCCDYDEDCPGGHCKQRRDAPGGLRNLPWGQLVFDYFTALPLSSSGPYRNPTGDPEFVPAQPDSIPRVDLDGLRVHGRININAAPWKVLAGLPLMSADHFPAVFRDKIKKFADLRSKCVGGSNDGQPCSSDAGCPGGGSCKELGAPIGDDLAQAIVAYRELRPIKGSGDYGTGAPAQGMAGYYPRGWDVWAPIARRGSGFMSVGELVNVRHGGAFTDTCENHGLLPPCVYQPVAGYDRYSYYRTDAGMIDDTATDEDYVSAVALLVALGDWVTVRSQVFTVYGTLRGEIDQSIVGANQTVQNALRAVDVDSRALRFQETVDRLPTFLGEPLPVRIGERAVTRYVDVMSD
ncbi:MAG: hypothetical protein WBE26_19055, partial [Phycisphaerae bacterium]